MSCQSEGTRRIRVIMKVLCLESRTSFVASVSRTLHRFGHGGRIESRR